MAFKENLINARKAACPNAKDFAKKLGISYTTYLSYEKGAWPNEENLLKIAAALNVSIDNLLGYAAKELPREINLSRHSGLAVEEQGGLVKVDVSPDVLARLDRYDRAIIENLDLSPVSPADFVKSVKIGRQLVIDKYPKEFIFQILMGIDYRNNPPPGSEEYEAKQKKLPAE